MQSAAHTRKLKPVIFVYHMAGSQLEVDSAEKDLTSLITSRRISKSMCNALKDQQAPGIYTEKNQTPDSSKALRLDTRHTLP